MVAEENILVQGHNEPNAMVTEPPATPRGERMGEINERSNEDEKEASFDAVNNIFQDLNVKTSSESGKNQSNVINDGESIRSFTSRNMGTTKKKNTRRGTMEATPTPKKRGGLDTPRTKALADAL